MKAFLILVRLRLKEVRTSAATGFVYFGLPLLLLLITGFMFMKGPPFERRKLSLVAKPGRQLPAALMTRLQQMPDLRWQLDQTREIAINKLNAHSVNAVIVFDESTEVIVGGGDELFGRGIISLIREEKLLNEASERAALQVVALPRWGYVHYLFPGMLTWTIIVDGLFGMGYSMVHYRRNRFLKKLSITPISKFTFVGAQIVSRAVLAFLQMLLLATVAKLIFQISISLIAALWLAAFTILGLFVFMGAGFALASAIKSEVTMLDTVNAVTVVIILISEIFFSADELPSQLGQLSVLLPSTQLVRLLRAVVLYGDTSAAVMLPGLLVLTAWLIATYTISVFAFKWYD